MGNATLRGDDGRTRMFTNTGTGYLAPAGYPAVLTENVDGTWHVDYSHGGGLRFDAGGALTRVSHRDGTYVDVAYSAGRLSQAVASVGGRSLTWASDANGRVQTVTADDGRAVHFTYTGDLLTSATAIDGGVTSYTYDANGYLATIVDGDGRTRVSSTYDAIGRVISQVSAHGQRLDFDYSDDATRTTTVTGATTGEVTTFRFDPQARLVEVLDATTHAVTRSYSGGYLGGAVDRNLAEVSQVVDAHGNVTSRTYPWGTESFVFDVADRLTSHTNVVNATTEFAYTGSARIPSVVTWPGQTTTTQTVVDGLVTAVEDADGVRTEYAYDAARNLITVTDGLGNETTMTYDAAGRMLTRTTAELRTTTWTYDTAGRVTSVTDPAGGVTTHTYDHAGHVMSTTDPDDSVTEYTYDNAGELAIVEHPDGTTTTYVRDDRGNVLSETRPGGAVTIYVYGVLDRLVSTTDPAGVTTTFSYDANGAVTATTDEAGNARTTTYDAAGNVLTTTDELDRTTTYVRDALGRVTSMTDAAGAVTTTTYDSRGRVRTVTDPLLKTTTNDYTPGGRLDRVTYPGGAFAEYTYDAEGRLVVATGPGGDDTTSAYDDDGFLTSTTSPGGITRTYTYDGAGRVLTSTVPGEGVTTTTYSPGGRVLSLAEPGKGTVAFTYDAMGRVLTATDANDHVTTYSYDGRGNRVGVVDVNAGEWSWTYDGADRVTAATDPLGRSTTTTYDGLGRVATVADAAGRTRAFTYDGAGQVTRTTLGDGSFVDYTYDGAGRVLTATDASGTEANTYDEAGRVLSNSYGGRTVRYTYDELGRVATITYPGGAVVTNTFAAEGALTGVARTGGATAAYTYDDDGRVLTESLPGGTTRSYGYTAGQLTTYTETTTVGTSSSTITRGAGGKVASLTTDGALTSYTYDDAGQLTGVDAPGTNDDVTYLLDPVGNITGRTTGGVATTFTYDAADQLTTSTTGGVTTTYGYDAAGRLLSSTDGTVGVATTYDARGRTASTTVGGGSLDPTTTRARSYTPTDRLASVVTEDTVYSLLGVPTTTTATTTLTWDVARGIPEVLALTTNAGTSDVAYGVGKAFVSVAGAAAVPFSRDAFGSLRQTAATLGVVVPGTFGAYGDPSGGDPGVGFGYRGELHVGDRLHLRAREHEPLTSRFTSRDPLDGIPGEPVATSPYHYAGNDPINAADPSGLDPSITDPYLSGAVGILPGGGSAAVAVVGCSRFLEPATAGTSNTLSMTVTDQYLMCVMAVSTAAAAGANVIDDIDMPTSNSDSSSDDEPRPSPRPGPRVPTDPPPIPHRNTEIVLFHYTMQDGARGITATGMIQPSSEGAHSRYGRGQYFTDMPPYVMSRGNVGDASFALFGTDNARDKVRYYVAVNVKGLPVRHVSAIYDTRSYGRRFRIHVHRSDTDLPLAGRLRGVGRVRW
jgi:RHS repeat-associated protein